MIKEFVSWLALVSAIFICGAILYLAISVARERLGVRYTVTVKNSETVHRNARIRVTEGAVLRVTDAQGREYIYREGWEAVEEQDATVK